MKRSCEIDPNGYNQPVTDAIKGLRWVSSSKKDLLAMPEDVIDLFGFALHLAQTGQETQSGEAAQRLWWCRCSGGG